MYDVTLGNKALWKRQTDNLVAERSLVQKRDIDSTLKIRWEEHCVECAIPECYSSCTLYKKRSDGACARFVYGIVPHPKFKGHYNFGADITFRPWGKLEASLGGSVTACLLPHVLLDGFLRLSGEYQKLLFPIMKKLFGRKKSDLDEFVLECYSPQDHPFKLVLEYFTITDGLRESKFRHSFLIRKGRNFYKLPFHDFNMDVISGYVYLYPERNDGDVRIIFTWLDFVRYKVNRPRVKEEPKKIKCLAWDLDNTMWTGILVEGAEPEVTNEIREVIKEIDERGILQTIVSKNNHSIVWPLLEKLNLADYFLFPAINWGQKSQSLIKISKRLNLNLDSFALVDDSEFERSEVNTALPQVRTYSEKELPNMLAYKEFDVPVTEFSKLRRKSYQQEVERFRVEESFSGNYRDFLKECQMVLDIFKPREEDQIIRVWELIQRSNQLNLSSKRYSLEELRTTLSDPTILSLALRCKDKFGDYGIVGFSTICLKGEIPIVEDFLLSCRVARKTVEHAFFKYLCTILTAHKYPYFLTRIVKTQKNQALQQVFSELPFEVVHEGLNESQLKMRLDSVLEFQSVIEIERQEELI